ncbi:MAG: hypothetical protein M3R04_04305 [bacterium]|nr:hypothetical protein [bacterium]
MRLCALIAVGALCSMGAHGVAHAQELPAAEISTAVAAPAPDAASGEAAAADVDYIEVSSRGYSRFEISDDGHILVVYSGGVEFSYLGYKLSASELRFDQATRKAQVMGDVRISSKQLVLSSQSIELDGAAGTGRVNGHLVGNLPQYGVSFEANEATLTFPAGNELPSVSSAQLTLAGEVTLRDSKGITLLTDQVAYDGSSGRISTAPFALRGSMPSKTSTVDTYQLQGMVASAQLSDGGGIAELSVLDLLLVTKLARISAERAVARPGPDGQGWKIAFDGAPLRIETNVKMKPPGAAAAVTQPALIQANRGLATIDGAGLSSASLIGGVVVSSLGNRLESASVIVTRRATGYAIAAGGLRVGLDLSRLTGLKPVDLANLIE